MNTKAQKALEVLKDGGYWRKQLETSYRGGEKFKTRLRNAEGRVVPGFGIKTFCEHEDAGVLTHKECSSSSVWPQEWKLI